MKLLSLLLLFLTVTSSWAGTTVSGGVTTITTTGTSGAATLSGSSLNIPRYDQATSSGVSSFNTRSGTVTLTQADVNAVLPTSLGTVTVGTWNGTAIANANLANSAITLNTHSVSLGGSLSLTAADVGAQPAGSYVTSVGLSSPGVVYTVSGSPVTSSGTLALNLVSQNANTVFAGPTSGGAAAPSFQTAPTISAANMTSFPTLNQNTSGSAGSLLNGPSFTTSTGTLTLANGQTLATTGSGTLTLSTGGSASTFLNAGGNYSTPAGTTYFAGTGLTLNTGTFTVTNPLPANLTVAVTGTRTLTAVNTGTLVTSATSLVGDVTGTAGATVVGKINGTTIPSASSTALGIAPNATGGFVKLASGVPVTDVYISYRTDSVAGDGTVNNPYDGSSQTKFDTVMASIPVNTNIHIGAGNFSTFGSANFYLQTGWKIYGAGQGVTTITLTGATGGWTSHKYYHFSAWTSGAGTTQVQTDNVEIHDLTCDVSYTGSPYTAHYAVGGISIAGNNLLVDHVEVIGCYGDTTSGYEQFCFLLGSPTTTPTVFNDVISNCYTHGYHSGSNYTNSVAYGFMTNCRIINCYDDGANHGFTFSGCENAIVSGCTTTNNTAIAFYHDTGLNTNLLITNNVFYASANPISFQNFGSSTNKRIVISNNILSSNSSASTAYGILFQDTNITSASIINNTFFNTGGSANPYLLNNSGGVPIFLVGNNVPGQTVTLANLTTAFNNTTGSCLLDTTVYGSLLEVTSNNATQGTFYSPTAPNASTLNTYFGVNGTSGNAGVYGFQYVSSGSLSNFAYLGVNQKTYGITQFGNGRGGIYGSGAPTDDGTTAWNVQPTGNLKITNGNLVFGTSGNTVVGSASVTASTMAKWDSGKGLVSATAGTDYVAPGGGGLAPFTQTASVTVANTVTETTLTGSGVGTLTIPANTLVAGGTYRIRADGYIADLVTPTLDLKLKLGSTAIDDTSATALVTLTGTSQWTYTGNFTCRTTGGSGTVQTQGLFAYFNGTTPLVLNSPNTATTTIDTTASQALTLTVTWGTASASNTITCTNLSLERVY